MPAADDSQTTATATKDDTILNIPEETLQKFPELVEFIKASPSMNDEERQYWVDVLPIMTDEQIENLSDILTNEKKQIDTINQEYQQDMDDAASKAKKAFDESAYRERKMIRLEAERLEEEKEKENEEALLQEMEGLL